MQSDPSRERRAAVEGLRREGVPVPSLVRLLSLPAGTSEHDWRMELAAAREAARAMRATRTRARTSAVYPKGRRRLAAVFLVLGVLLLAEAVLTVAWKEPVSSFYAARAQDQLEDELGRLEVRADPNQSQVREAQLRTAAERLGDRSEQGHALGRLAIDRIDLETVLVQGAVPKDLRRGPGHYAQSALPGEHGTVGIAGHRTTYSAPFREIDKLRRGDRISLRMPYGRFVYEVRDTRVVDADRRGMLADGRQDRLVLSTCHPAFSAKDRIVVSADLVQSEPAGRPGATGAKGA